MQFFYPDFIFSFVFLLVFRKNYVFFCLPFTFMYIYCHMTRWTTLYNLINTIELDNTRTPLHMDGGLDHFFPNSIPLDLAKDGFTIIWRFSKNKNFPKIWRLWLKNCVHHAHFNFELLKGVAASFFKLYPSNFSQACIFYRPTNDVFTAELYL